LTAKNQDSGFDVDMNYQVMSAPDEEKQQRSTNALAQKAFNLIDKKRMLEERE
jgi:hypothetical protein